MIPLKKVSNKDEKEEFDKAMWLYKKQKNVFIYWYFYYLKDCFVVLFSIKIVTMWPKQLHIWNTKRLPKGFKYILWYQQVNRSSYR